MNKLETVKSRSSHKIIPRLAPPSPAITIPCTTASQNENSLPGSTQTTANNSIIFGNANTPVSSKSNNQQSSNMMMNASSVQTQLLPISLQNLNANNLDFRRKNSLHGNINDDIPDYRVTRVNNHNNNNNNNGVNILESNSNHINNPNNNLNLNTPNGNNLNITENNNTQANEKHQNYMKWKRGFKKWVFYFDGVDTNKEGADLAAHLRELGAKVVLFMDLKTITHIITSKSPDTQKDTLKENAVNLSVINNTIPTTNVNNSINNTNNSNTSALTNSKVNQKNDNVKNGNLKPETIAVKSPLNTDKSSNKIRNNIFSIAQNFKIKIWSVETTQKIVNTLCGLKAESKPSRLQDHLRNEKLYGLSTNRDPENSHTGKFNWYCFKGKYLLVEDLSERYKPIMIKEYKDKPTKSAEELATAKATLNPSQRLSQMQSPWPELSFHSREGRCAFVRYPTSEIEADRFNNDAKGLTGLNGANANTVASRAAPPITEPQVKQHQKSRKKMQLDNCDNVPPMKKLKFNVDDKSNNGLNNYNNNNFHSNGMNVNVSAIRDNNGIDDANAIYGPQQPASLASGLVSGSLASHLVSGSATTQGSLGPIKEMINDPRFGKLGERQMVLNSNNSNRPRANKSGIRQSSLLSVLSTNGVGAGGSSTGNRLSCNSNDGLINHSGSPSQFSQSIISGSNRLQLHSAPNGKIALKYPLQAYSANGGRMVPSNRGYINMPLNNSSNITPNSKGANSLEKRYHSQQNVQINSKMIIDRTVTPPSASNRKPLALSSSAALNLMNKPNISFNHHIPKSLNVVMNGSSNINENINNNMGSTSSNITARRLDRDVSNGSMKVSSLIRMDDDNNNNNNNNNNRQLSSQSIHKMSRIKEKMGQNNSNSHNFNNNNNDNNNNNENKINLANIQFPKTHYQNRPGYCENCGTKFEVFEQHINSRQHRTWARNNTHFGELDILIAKMSRKPVIHHYT